MAPHQAVDAQARPAARGKSRARAKNGDCHQFAPRHIPRNKVLSLKRIGWLYPIFRGLRFHHGLLNRGFRHHPWAALLVLLPLLVFVPSSAALKKLRLEAIVSDGGLTGPTPTQLRWSPDGRLLSYILQREDPDKRDLWAIDRISGENRVLVTSEKLATLAPAAKQATTDERERERRLRYSVASYLWSPDSQSILFTSSGRLYLYDLAAKKARPLAPGKRGVRNPRFSPHGRWVSFLYEHDIWLVPPSGGEERRLTWGATDTLFHGDLDWIYPEEFAIRSGYEWSPDGRRLVFLEIDQSLVPTYPIPDLLDLAATVDLQRYPKPGDPNPQVRVGIIEAKPGDSGKPRIHWVDRRGEYIPRMAWAGNDLVAVQLLNRSQNELELIFADVRNGRSRTVLAEKDSYWINVTDDLNFLKESKELLWTSERTGFRHIYLYGYDGRQRRPLTEGPWEVSKVVDVDAESGWVYYLANEDNPLGNDLYRIKLEGNGKERLTNGKGSHSILMNAPKNAYADTRSTLTTAAETVVRDPNSDKTTLVHRSWPLDEYELVKPELVELKSSDGALVRVMLIKPRPLDAKRRYPALMYVYGGPHAPTIRDAWGRRYLFHQYLAQKGYVVAYVDDRASSLRGHRYEAAIRENYGPTALEDQLAAVKYLRSLDFVDPKRIAIWGWSGGGFSACFALTHSDVFKAGVAVAPVTDWRLYDSIYTERYMGHPAKQAEAYRKTSAVEAAENLNGRLLLVHPTSDDNVHIQNTMQFIDALVKAGKPYDLLVYPGKTHSIHGEAARIHLFRGIEDFLGKHL